MNPTPRITTHANIIRNARSEWLRADSRRNVIRSDSGDSFRPVRVTMLERNGAFAAVEACGRTYDDALSNALQAIWADRGQFTTAVPVRIAFKHLGK